MITRKIIQMIAWGALGSGLVISISRADTILADGYECERETWVRPMDYDRKDGLLKGTLTSLCRAHETKKEGLISLDKTLLNYTLDRAEQIHSGPIPGKMYELPGVKYDITMKINNGQNPMYIREDLISATDGKTRHYYAQLSRSIRASGMADAVKKLDVIIDTVPDETGGFYFRISGTIYAQKPFYIPSETFRSKAQQFTQDQYLEIRGNWAPRINDAL